MPQLDTSTWFITIVSMIFSLFMLLQPKISAHSFPPMSKEKPFTPTKHSLPWTNKWTKIYSPLLPHQH
uniref:ATP synthase complex subunit 8 n=1 Tax=Trichys fasciculata TaxID=73865 RepID=A0A343CEG8_9HYST|nr:ATP synthase F0 subunit 8 [Trichys fasciculata]ARM56461.1 ATP synthase F0 subunit 8 [Trichys fasciculata]